MVVGPRDARVAPGAGRARARAPPKRLLRAADGCELTAIGGPNGRADRRIDEQADAITLGDNEGRKHKLAKKNIEEQRAQTASTMPEGLEKRLTADEFVDLIAFLAAQKDPRQR